MNDKNWMPIKDYEGLYEISDFGEVRSLQKRNHGNLVKKRIDRAGYYSVRLSSKGKNKSYFVHRLVALHFIPNPSLKPQVNHISGDKLDNRVSNLEWVTHSENMKHAYATGLLGSKQSFKSKPVIDICTGVEYPSILAALNAITISYSEFRRKLAGQSPNDTCFRLVA